MKWRTKNGTILDIKEMTDSHLVNAINYAKRRNKEGVEIMGGSPSDIDSMWFEIDHNFYDEDIKEFEEETKKRGL